MTTSPDLHEGKRKVIITGPTVEIRNRGVAIIYEFLKVKDHEAHVNSQASLPPASSSRSQQQQYQQNYRGTNANAAPLGQQESYAFTDTLQIGNSKAGLVIGKNGSTIKGMQQKYNSKIVVPSQAEVNANDTRTVTIQSNQREVIEAIKYEILGIADGSIIPNYTVIEKPYEGPQSLGEGEGELIVKVPNDKAGLIIGKQGATIKDLKSRYQVRIFIPQACDPGTQFRSASVIGNLNNVQRAVQEIMALITYNAAGGGGMVVKPAQLSAHQYNLASPAAGAASADYSNQWSQYYAQVATLPPDQQQQAFLAIAQQQAQQSALQSPTPVSPEQMQMWQQYYYTLLMQQKR